MRLQCSHSRDLCGGRERLLPRLLAHTKSVAPCFVTRHAWQQIVVIRLMGNDVQLCPRPAHFHHRFLKPDKSLAAAICCKADAIATMIRKHFPQQTRNTYDIETQHPDDIFMN